jgi:hypothetical protein
MIGSTPSPTDKPRDQIQLPRSQPTADQKARPGHENTDTDIGVGSQVDIPLEQLTLEVINLPPAKKALRPVQDHALFGVLEGLENLSPNLLFPLIPPQTLTDHASLAHGLHQGIINPGN